jgi:hypothetical protein
LEVLQGSDLREFWNNFDDHLEKIMDFYDNPDIFFYKKSLLEEHFNDGIEYFEKGTEWVKNLFD